MFLGDNDDDKVVKRKNVVGQINGVNKRFWTFDDRLVAKPAVYVDEAPIAAADVTLEDAVLGQFLLASAPATGATLQAQYRYHYFLDAELQAAVQVATGEFVETDNVTQVDPGLKLAVLNIAGSHACTRQSVRWMERASDRFMADEKPTREEALARSATFKDMARTMLSAGRQLRLDFFQNHGRRVRPAFTTVYQVLPPLGPRR